MAELLGRPDAAVLDNGLEVVVAGDLPLNFHALGRHASAIEGIGRQARPEHHALRLWTS
jgi:hypothetical protein